MLLNSWSAALMVCGVVALVLQVIAAFPAVKVLLRWDLGSDSAPQIRLEQQTWLAAMLVQYGMVLQILSLILLVLAADNFANFLAGAMCAAGSFAANGFGLPALYVKIFSVFLYGLWLVIHRLDLHSEEMVLTRLKFALMLLLLPLTLGDVTLVFCYLLSLQPDVITSCCGVLYAAPGQSGWNVVGESQGLALAAEFYLLALTLFILAGAVRFRQRPPFSFWGITSRLLLGCLSPLFVVIALLSITQFFSPYIYALPSHRCPFDILQSAYHGIGFLIYGCLLGGSFALLTGAVLPGLGFRYGLTAAAEKMAQGCLRYGTILLAVFLALVSFYPLRYLLGGGEW
jgi:hypothetical protein